jgi:hypothetical protein
MFKIKIVIAMMCLGSMARAAVKNLNIQDAINAQLVSADFRAIGGITGKCMEMQLTNLKNDSIVVNIPAGTYLDCLDDALQDIMILTPVKRNNCLGCVAEDQSAARPRIVRLL